MMKLLKENGAQLLAYSPLGMGRLTGKYSAKNPPQGKRGFGQVPWKQLQPLVDELTAIGKRSQKTPGQVALNWVICQGAVPIAGAKNQVQASENAGAMSWRLQPQEIANLTRLGQMGGYSNWQHG
jgi:aryl-alcohol dehydrogenase-like predicted oxidoreductase